MSLKLTQSLLSRPFIASRPFFLFRDDYLEFDHIMVKQGQVALVIGEMFAPGTWVSYLRVLVPGGTGMVPTQHFRNVVDELT